MEDVQSGPAGIAIPINRVGIRGITMPLLVRQRDSGTNGTSQRTVASVDISVDLPAEFKGTHMSRFIESLQFWTQHSDALDYEAMRHLLSDTCDRLKAKRAHVVFRFPYFLSKKAPSSGIPSAMHYDCVLTGELSETDGTAGRRPEFTLEVTVPVMTVCPCSKAISDEGAHSQRTYIHMTVRMKRLLWIEDLIEFAEMSASSPVYTLLKRQDEKYVTEHAFAHPTFVEDVVRNVAARLQTHPHVRTFKVEVESHESIHAHNAFACIEG